MNTLCVEQANSLQELFSCFPEEAEGLKRSFLNNCYSAYMVWCGAGRGIQPNSKQVDKRCVSHLNDRYANEEPKTFDLLKQSFLDKFRHPLFRPMAGGLLGREVVDLYFDPPPNVFEEMLQALSRQICNDLAQPFEKSMEGIQVEEASFLFPPSRFDKGGLKNQTTTTPLNKLDGWMILGLGIVISICSFVAWKKLGSAFCKASRTPQRTAIPITESPLLNRLGRITFAANHNGYVQAATLLISLSSYLLI